MKHLITFSAAIILLFAFISSCNGIPPPIGWPPGPPTCEPKDEGEFKPDLTACSFYYQCINGVAVRKQCSSKCGVKWFDAIDKVFNKISG